MTTRTFKAGNSVAVRFPARMRVQAGVEMRVTEEQGKYVVEPVEPVQRTVDVSGFWGKAPWLSPLGREDRDFEERTLDWTAEQSKRDG